MAYILTYVMPGGLKYWVQERKGEIILNGLKDNAKTYDKEWQAKDDIPRCKIHLGLEEKGALLIEEILPTT